MYGFVIIIRFSYWLIIHDDKTIVSYFMPRHQKLKFHIILRLKDTMWIWWTKINRNPSIMRHLSVIKWRNWHWWESYLNTGIIDETQIAVVVWPCAVFNDDLCKSRTKSPWTPCLFLYRGHNPENRMYLKCCKLKIYWCYLCFFVIQVVIWLKEVHAGNQWMKSQSPIRGSRNFC